LFVEIAFEAASSNNVLSITCVKRILRRSRYFLRYEIRIVTSRDYIAWICLLERSTTPLTPLSFSPPLHLQNLILLSPS